MFLRDTGATMGLFRKSWKTACENESVKLDGLWVRAPTDRREKRGAAVSDGALGGTGAESDCGDRIALRVKDAAKMLGVSISAMYEMIGKRQIGVLRLGDHRSIRIPNTEIERLLSENLVPALGESD